MNPNPRNNKKNGKDIKCGFCDKTLRHSRDSKEWRKAVFERDGYRCVACGLKGGWNKELKTRIILNADHIYQFSKFPRLRLMLENGQTLCKDCHFNKTMFERTGKMIIQGV